MLKTRVIPILLLQDGLIKKPVQFKNPRTIANAISIVRVFEERQVDELILLDIAKTLDEEEVDLDVIRRIADELFVPFTYGGGIKSLNTMKEIIQAGAEKIVINTAAVETPGIISEGVQYLGSQCIVVSVDAMFNGSFYEVYTHSGNRKTGIDVIEHVRLMEDLGVGEILINSIKYDGKLNGYDIELIKVINDSVSIPVICAGGAANLKDFVLAIKEGGASAVAAGSIFHYTKTTPNMVKGTLASSGIPVRLYSDSDYSYNY